MAQLAVQVPIFVSSPSDVHSARLVSHQEIMELSREAARHHLALHSYLWERDHFAASGSPQVLLNEELRRTDLVVVILSTRIGPGTREELQEALELARTGIIDNVSIYFLTPEGGWSEASDEVREIRHRIQSQGLALTQDCVSTEEFRDTLRRQLRIWLQRWYGVLECCMYALRRQVQSIGADFQGKTAYSACLNPTT